MPEKVAVSPVDWTGSSKKDLMTFPRKVIHDIGLAISIAQHGGKADNAKPLKQFGGAVLEVVENHDKDTYRAVYTVRLSDRIYVLHCFQKSRGAASRWIRRTRT